MKINKILFLFILSSIICSNLHSQGLELIWERTLANGNRGDAVNFFDFNKNNPSQLLFINSYKNYKENTSIFEKSGFNIQNFDTVDGSSDGVLSTFKTALLDIQLIQYIGDTLSIFSAWGPYGTTLISRMHIFQMHPGSFFPNVLEPPGEIIAYSGFPYGLYYSKENGLRNRVFTAGNVDSAKIVINEVSFIDTFYKTPLDTVLILEGLDVASAYTCRLARTIIPLTDNDNVLICYIRNESATKSEDVLKSVFIGHLDADGQFTSKKLINRPPATGTSYENYVDCFYKDNHLFLLGVYYKKTVATWTKDKYFLREIDEDGAIIKENVFDDNATEILYNKYDASIPNFGNPHLLSWYLTDNKDLYLYGGLNKYSSTSIGQNYIAKFDSNMHLSYEKKWHYNDNSELKCEVQKILPEDGYIYIVSDVGTVDNTDGILYVAKFEEPTTAIHEENTTIINIYPNPTSKLINFDVPIDQVLNNLELFALNGNLLCKFNTDVTTLDLSAYNTGEYYLCFTLNNTKYYRSIILSK